MVHIVVIEVDLTELFETGLHLLTFFVYPFDLVSHLYFGQKPIHAGIGEYDGIHDQSHLLVRDLAAYGAAAIHAPPCATRALTFAIIAIAAAVGLGPHRHLAVGAVDESFRQVLPFRVGLQCAGAARILLGGQLDRLEYFIRDQGFVLPKIEVFSVPDLTGVEPIVKDSSHRCRGKQPRLGHQFTVGVGQFLGVTGPEAFLIQKAGQCKPSAKVGLR